jgi:hypothetical protein
MMDITPEMAAAELQRRKASQGITPEMARAELARRQAPEQDGGWLKGAGEALADSNEGIKQGLTLGFGDELMAGLMTPIEMGAQAIRGDDVSMSGAYNTNLERERGALKQAQQRSPVASTVGNIAGGVMTAGGLSKGGLTLLNGAKPTVASMAGRGAAEGAAYGAVQGFGSGEGGVKNRGAESLKGATIGGIAGGALGAAGAVHAKRAANKTVATIEKLRADKDAAYAAVDQSGHRYQPAEFDSLIGSMTRRLQAERASPMRHPKAASMMDDIANLRGSSPTLTELDQLRQVVSRDVAGATDPAERRLGTIMIKEIDNFIATRPGNELINKARSLNTRLSKAEKLGTAMTKAERQAASTGSGGNIENATRQKVRQILDNPKQSRGFSKVEVEAMEAFVRGGKLQNFLRLIGKLSPSGNGLMAALGIGGTVLNPVMALAPAAGMAAKKTAESMSRNSLNQLSAIVRNGGVAPQPALSQGGKALFDMATRESALQFPNLARQ